MESVEGALAAALSYVQATTMLLSDWPVKPVDALFFHARPRFDEDGLFELAAGLYRTRIVGAIAINGSDGEGVGRGPGEAWEGKAAWTSRLHSMGLPDPVFAGPGLHTKHENEQFLALAQERGWQTGVVLAQPYQLVRIMLGFVRSMADHGYWMRVRAVAPKTTDWQREVYGSQNAVLMPRFEHIWEELRRIPIYQAKGDIATFEELFQYLRWRACEDAPRPCFGGIAA